MLVKELRIHNFKVIDRLTLKPAKFNILIGPNGSGKSFLFILVVAVA